MNKLPGVTAMVVALIIGISACRQAGGTAAATRDLADQYGPENVEVVLRNHTGGSRVDVTVTDPSFAELDRTELQRRAREVGETVVHHVPLADDSDAVAVALVADDDEGVVQTTRTATFRFTPADLEHGAADESAP